MRFARRVSALSILACCAVPSPAFGAQERVRLGIEELLGRRIELVEGKRVGLVTNPSGVDGELVPTVDLLARDERVQLVQLYGPEHGIRGDVAAGDKVADSVDPVTGIAVESLYGSSRRPSAQSLANVDVLLFDIQDVGSRLYTYVSTLGETMHACADAGVPLVVLDRPNPLGGEEVEGPIREDAYRSFIGWGPVPVVHGLTVGEMARFYARELGIDCELDVVPMRGWRRSMVWEDTGLTWSQTSPHIPRVVHAHVYVATGMAAAITENVSDGVGSTMPFEVLGASFVDPRELARTMSALGLPGVRFQAISFRPFYGGFAGETLHGVRLVLDDPRAFRPLRTALGFLVSLQRLYPEELAWKPDEVFGKHWGNLRVLEAVRAGETVEEIEAGWRPERDAFVRARSEVLLYR